MVLPPVVPVVASGVALLVGVAAWLVGTRHPRAVGIAASVAGGLIALVTGGELVLAAGP